MTYQSLVVVLLAAGVLVAWARTRDDREGQTARERAGSLAWPLALALLTGSVIATLAGTYAFRNRSGLVLIALAAALLLALRPRLAKRVVPAGLILLGLAAFVAVRGWYNGASATWYGVAEISRVADRGSAHVVVSTFGRSGDAVIVAQGYLLLVVGGWLGWRELRNHPAAARLLLGRMALDSAAGQPWGLLLVPLVLALSVLAAQAWWTIPVLAVCVLVIRSWPRLAGQLAAVGTVAFGVLGLVASQGWYLYGRGSLRAAPGLAGLLVPARPPGASPGLYGLVIITSQATRLAATLQGLALIGFGCWLVPRTFPAVGRLLGRGPAAELTRQVRQLTQSRAVAVDTAASDLRRLERDLHDGAQARLVALGMNLRAAERLIPLNPDAALALVAEARDTSARALTELRELIRGVHPPVLADRGLADAVRALALDSPLHVDTRIDLPGRPPAPVETACYFAVAELLTNAAKHSGARAARVDVTHADRMLRIDVTDFGLGGADPAAGSGLAGVEKRLAAFDGIMAISSPPGGPTIVVLEVPCALSSPKISTC
jgi:signal transduction histidine kinase